MKKFDIANIFYSIADILELRGENLFRIRAYRKAARNIESLAKDLKELSQKERLEEIPGIGHDLALKIKEYLDTGKIEFYEKVKRTTPKALLEMTAVPGVGPKTAKLLYDKLKIKSISDLESKTKHHKIEVLPGLGRKTEENILKGIAFLKRSRGKMLLSTATSVANDVIRRLKRLPEVKKISAAGSLRRMKETVRDIDILVISKRPAKVMKAFTNLPQIKQVLAHGATKSSIITDEDVQVDVRVMQERSFGAALLYFTGSKAHNIILRKLAKKKGLKINEYGVFKSESKKILAGRTEEEIYKALDMQFIPPELREEQGEVDAALKKRLPKLVELKDIKADFHMHSQWSDGRYTIEEMAREAKKRGYKYIAITDHSKRLKIAGGLSDRDRWKQIETIRKLNKKIRGIEIIAGAEVEITDDGSIDYDNDILKELDIVIGAIHSGFNQSKEKLTKRIVTAVNNKYVHILAHPTGRLIGAREPYELDMEKVFKEAKNTNTAIEINAHPDRLDLNDIGCRRAKELGIMITIGTDAHAASHLDYMHLGVSVARRGWLQKKDVLNTYPWTEARKRLKR